MTLYKNAGVDIAAADRAKKAMAKDLETRDPRVLNRLGAFASLFEASFPGIEHPVLVLKMEEPGSKQKLAATHGKLVSVCEDLVHHLVNDIVVMGATPLAVLDLIVCGKLEGDTVQEIVRAVARSCTAQGCSLVGGETSEQPGVLEEGTYILAASIVGVVDKAKIIDGSAIREGDMVLAVASNGPHTNGYTLIRKLLSENTALAKRKIGSETFLEAVMRPHACYYQAFKELFGNPSLHGMAHITGGGIQGNLNRILPEGLSAEVDISKIQILPVFKLVREAGNVSDADLLRTFNMGVGMTLVVGREGVPKVREHLKQQGHESYPIGRIAKGRQQALLQGRLQWYD